MLLTQPSTGLALLFEGISSVSNTGLTMGATGLLNTMGIFVVCALMILGKMGFITMVISFFPRLEILLEKAKHYHNEFPVD